MGALKWGLKATLSNSRNRLQLCTFFCGLLIGPLSKGNFRRKMTTVVGNCGKLWTSTLSPHLPSPHFDFPENSYNFEIACDINLRFLRYLSTETRERPPPPHAR